MALSMLLQFQYKKILLPFTQLVIVTVLYCKKTIKQRATFTKGLFHQMQLSNQKLKISSPNISQYVAQLALN